MDNNEDVNPFIEFKESGGYDALFTAIANSDYLIYVGGIENVKRYIEATVNGPDDWLSVDDDEEE